MSRKITQKNSVNSGRMKFSVSLPKKMGRLIDHYAQHRGQERSEFVRFILQKEIIDRREPIELSKKELAELDDIEAEMRGGKHVTLDQLRYEMEGTRNQEGRNKKCGTPVGTKNDCCERWR